MNSTNKSSPRPFGLRFLEIPGNQLANVGGGADKQPEQPEKQPERPDNTITTEALSVPATPCGRPDQF
jgi:hypothetical protein